MGPYVGDVKLWLCPAAEPVTVGKSTLPRIRTVSLSCFMGSPVKSPAASTYLRLGDIVRPSPAEALTFVEERVETINDGSFALQWPFNDKQPEGWMLRDKPGVAHDRSGNLTFADGHVETHRWEDRRTLDPARDDAVLTGNLDVLWMQRHATWRE
jgi:prepilin-type processing-associated H-X9-DG protein